MVKFDCLTPDECIRALREYLQNHQNEDADFEARELVRFVLGQDPRLVSRKLSGQEAELLTQLARRRAAHEPLQYLEGSWAFLDMELLVGPGVLIPRSDTETVCEAAANTIKNLQNASVLDLCAGSGCLGLGVARLVPGCRVTAVEKSPEALTWLRRNAQKYGTPQNCTIVSADVFGFEKDCKERYHLIVSNPPYLTAKEMNELQPEVRYEPAMALDGGEDGLRFYRYIAREYKKLLLPGGALVFEIGWQQAEAVSELLSQNGYVNISVLPDWEGRPRTCMGFLP